MLGEFTIARNLSKHTFPTFVFDYFGVIAQGGIALALFTLVGTTALLRAVHIADPRQGTRRMQPRSTTTPVATVATQKDIAV